MTEPLRIIESPIGPVVPVADIARQFGRERSTITRILNKPANKALFAGCLSTQRIATKAGSRPCVCITKTGMEELISHLRPINQDNLPERIGKFRETLMKRSTVPALSDVLTEYGKRARALANEWDVDITVARKVLMAAAVEKYTDLAPCRALIPANSSPLELPEKTGSNSSEPELPKADPDFERYYSLEKLAEYCQCSSDTARNILEKKRVIERVNGIWRLTMKGMQEPYGKMFPHMPWYPHLLVLKWAIRYHPNAVQLVRGELLGISSEPAQYQIRPGERAQAPG
jgi:hypothetical protein